MNTENLNELRDRAYQCAIKHGWHEQQYSDDHFLCLVISELMESVEADREGKRSQVAMFKEWQGNSIPLTEETKLKRFKEDFEEFIKGTVEEELSDACIRLLDLAGLRQLELTYTNSLAIMSKMSFTEYIYCLCSFITNPDKSNSKWLDNHISYSLGWIFSWCRAKNIDIAWHIDQKMKYNELRPYMHGGKAY